jgi:phosphomannomutase
MKIAYLFDVDGVLCDTGCVIDPEFNQFFLDWAKDKDYYLITGGERQSTIDQVGLDIVQQAKIGFHCMGNQIVIDDREYKINQFQLTEPEYWWLENYALESPYPIKTGNNIEKRIGSINYSVLGKNATVEQKKEYFEWDSINKERMSLVKQISNLFPRLEAFIGGNASIDICLHGANKSLCIDMIKMDYQQLIFFGDKCFPYGIDYPIKAMSNSRPKEITVLDIQYGYKETCEKLKTL